MRHAWAGLCLVALLAACGSDSLTVSEYAAQAEDLVAEMESQFVALDQDWVGQPATAERARDYWRRRLIIRAEFLDGVEDLDPPEAVADQHAAAVDVFTRITQADEALAARVATYGTVTEHWQWVDTPEGQAADAILEEVYSFCRASQAEYDATQDREPLGDVAWIPDEMSEIVSVAFGCPPQEP